MKKGKLDASGTSRASNANVAEIHNRVLMMLSHEIFDPEIGKRVLVDHAYIVASGEITRQARNWLGHTLDASQRRSIIFRDRTDILDLFVVTGLPLPTAALPLLPTCSTIRPSEKTEPVGGLANPSSEGGTTTAACAVM